MNSVNSIAKSTKKAKKACHLLNFCSIPSGGLDSWVGTGLLKTQHFHRLCLNGNTSNQSISRWVITSSWRPPHPGGRGRVAPLRATSGIQDTRRLFLFSPYPDFYVFGDFTISPRWLWCYLVNFGSPETNIDNRFTSFLII